MFHESGRRLTNIFPADLLQNRAYRSGTWLIPCLRHYRLAVVRTQELESSLLKPLVWEGCFPYKAGGYPPILPFLELARKLAFLLIIPSFSRFLLFVQTLIPFFQNTIRIHLSVHSSMLWIYMFPCFPVYSSSPSRPHTVLDLLSTFRSHLPFSFLWVLWPLLSAPSWLWRELAG